MWSKWILLSVVLFLLIVELADSKPQKKQKKQQHPQKKQMHKRSNSGGHANIGRKSRGGKSGGSKPTGRKSGGGKSGGGKSMGGKSGGSGKKLQFSNNGPYFALPVVVGSQRTSLNLGIDGFYGSTAVYGPGTRSSHGTFDNTKSSSFKPAPRSNVDFEFSLGTGVGQPGDDYFAVGSMELNPTMFATLSSIPSFMEHKHKWSGYIAMWAPEDADDMKTTMQMLAEKNDQKTVTFAGPENQNDMHYVTFGGEDYQHCKNNWATFNNIKKLDPSEHISPWTMRWKGGFKWGEHNCNEEMNVALNVGANYFVAPRRHAEYFYKTLNAKHSDTYHGGMVDCSKIETAPKLELHAGNVTFSVSPKQYIKKFDSTNCLLNIYPDDLDQWTLPYMFHQKYCVKYDYGKKTVSIADSKKFG